MSLNFPASPTDGQVYDNWIYNSTKGAWEAKPLESAKTITADVAPANPEDGDQWFNTIDGTLYIYVVDIDGGQWVESQAPITANGYYSPNYIINGGFDINQRAFTSTTSNGVYGFDRWVLITNTGTSTYSAQSFGTTPTLTQGVEATNFARLAVSGQNTAASYSLLRQNIENVKLLAGKTVTVSFWAKAASGTPSVAATFEQYNGSAFTRFSGKKVTISTSWARYSMTFSIPSVTGQTVGADNITRTAFEIWVSAGSDFADATASIGTQSNTFDIWGVQVEEGTVATTFRRNANSIQGELAACQRYYQRFNSETAYGAIAFGWAYSVTQIVSFVNLKVSMRTLPISIEWSLIAAHDNVTSVPNVSSVALNGAVNNKDIASVNVVTGSGLTSLRQYWIGGNNTSNAYIAFNAEL